MYRVKAIWKYVVSFRKKEWVATDYPLRFRHNGSSIPGIPEWTVHIVNWTLMMGFGNSRDDALGNLRDRLKSYRELKGELPRPGSKVTIAFSSTASIEVHADLATALVTEVFGLDEDDPVFISDESSLWDFTLDDSLDHLFSKIQTAFGVDVSDIENGNVVDILERIHRSR